ARRRGRPSRSARRPRAARGAPRIGGAHRWRVRGAEGPAARCRGDIDMTSNAGRADILVRALHAGIEGDEQTVRALCVDDVRAWTPALSTTSVTELVAALADRDEAFSSIELDVAALEVGGDFACAEWTVAMTHTGPLAVAAGAVIEPTGLRVVL